MKEIGIYIHIPFCKSKCYYCDFTSFPNKNDKVEEYIKCLLNEIIYNASKDYFVKTIYIGGGTPSFIDAKYISKIMKTIKQHYNIDEKAEITIEANPGTVNEDKLKEYYQLGINRLSIGLQSANNDILKSIGRIHSYEQFEKTINLAKRQGFNNINSDMIIGLPNQSLEDVTTTANKLISLGLQHISVYSLIVEENTELDKLLNEGKTELLDEELERKMYWMVKKTLEEAGYIHYEISNFSKAGFQSKHNLDCWNQKEYLGFGVGASSYENDKRYSNIRCLEQYISNIKKGVIEKNRIIEETQNKEEKMNEYMMLGLRKIGGINIQDFENKFSENPKEKYNGQIEKLLKADLIICDNNAIKLTKKGIDLANLVWEEFV